MAFSVAGLAYPTTAVVPCVGCVSSNTIGLYPWLPANAPPNCNGYWTPKSLCQDPDNQSGVAPPSLVEPLCRVKVAAPETSQCHLILADSLRRSLMPGVSAPPLSAPWLCVRACSYVRQSYQI